MTKAYLFNVMTTWEVVAENEEEAWDKVGQPEDDAKGISMIDQDVMLVAVEDIPDE